MALPESDNIVNTTRLSSTLNRLWDKTKTKFATKADDSAVVHKTGDTMTGKLIMQKAINQVIKGTGVAATSSTSGSTTTYYPAKWNFDLGEANPTAGDRMVIQIPVAGSDYGEYISTDNGTTYYPVARNQGTTRLTTHYPAKAYICVVFEAYESADGCGKVGSIYPVDGGTARVTTTNGCWRVINDYDSGNTYERLYTGGRFYAGETGCYPYSLIALDSTGRYSRFISDGSGTGTTKTINTTTKFAYPPNVMYYAANNTAAAGALVSSYTAYEAFPGLDLRYSCNYVAADFATWKPVFIECTINSDGTWTPTSNSITQTLTAGNFYVYLGESSSYSLYFQAVNMMYYYNGTRLVSVNSKMLSAKANDADVVHKAGEEIITGRKIFQESVALSQYNSGENGYNAKCLGDFSVTQDPYSNWPEEAKDGHHYREWEIAVPYSVSMGEIRVTLTALGGVLQRTIRVDSCNTIVGIFSAGTNPDSLGGNNGYYTIADNDISSDFRISDLLWDSSLTGDYKFVIKIRSMHPERNASIASVIFETLGDTTHFEDVYIVSNDPQRVTGETYEVVRRGSVSSPDPSDGITIVETVSWLEPPKIQNCLGKDILVDGDIVQSSTNGNLSVLGTDVEVYSHPTQTAYTSKGTATKVPQITTDSTGHVTSISEVTISGVTPSSHASTATTYGIGTTSTYGHVKLATGDMNGATNTDGVAVSKNHTHSQYAPKASPALTGTPTAPTAADGTNTTQIATTAFVQSAVAQGLSVSDAMVYKGTVTLGATSPGGLTVAADKGHTYKVVANGNTKEGYVDGVKVEAGDMVICNTDSTAAATSSNYSTIAAKWDFVQGNTDGVVVGPASATSGNVVLFDGATGKLVKDGGTLGTAAFKSVTDTYSSTGTDPVSGKAVAAAINALDVSSVGGTGKYISAISETDGKISATATTMDTTPTANSTKAVTSGGIKTALDGKAASDHTHYRLVETDSATLLPNNAGGNNYKLYKSSFTDFCWCMFLYEITEFFDGTIVNAGSENSTFFGDVSILRLGGYPDIKNAKVGAMISYNTSTVLSSDSEKIMPIIAKQDVTYIHTWCTATNQCIAIGDVGSNVAIDTPTTLSTSRYTIIECENYTSLYVNAGWYSGTWPSVKTTVGAVWAFIDANNKVISRSAATAYGSNEILTVPSNAKKFICNCSGSYAAYAYVGIPAETSRYFLALDIRASAGTATLFGRFYTRATATSSYSARPLLLTSISNIGINSTSVPPVGWTEYRRGTHQTEAGTADKLTTARKLAVSLSNTSTDTSFDGSADVTNIKTTGTLPVANGGTGKTTVTAAEYNLLSKMGTDLSTNAIADNYRFVFATTSPSETNGRLAGYRTATAVWSWIKGKLTSDTGVNISGNAATATKATQDSDGNAINTTYLKELYQAEYGVSTFADVYAAVTAKKTVYCKVPGTTAGSARMAFLAYVNVSNPPTSSSNIEFQYYRSNSSGTGDSVFVYTITNNNNTWTTVERAADTNVKATAKTTDNVNYKILATASASPTSGAVTEAVYDPDITLNPSTNTISANVSGNAATASAAKSGSALETAINAKQAALTINDSKPITIGTAAAANTVAGQAHTHDGITSVARASVTNIDLPNSGTEPARMTLSQVTNATTQGTDPGDGYVLNLFWDNAGNWDTQIYVPNSKKADKDFGHLKVRYKNESSTWGDWEYLPGAFMGTLLTSSDDLDSLYQGIPGEVIQYYWKYTSKPICTSGLNKPGMIANNGLPTGTGSANLYAFHQSSTRTSEGIIVQVMICEDVGIYYRHRRGSSTGENWSQWTKVLLASDITTDTSTKNGKITIAGNDLTVYVHPAGSAASKTGVPTANATPAFGGTFKVNQITTDATSHVSAVTERTITIPNTTGNASTAGLTKLYTATGTNTDGTMTQNAIKSALDTKMSSTVSEDASNELQVVGVQSSATSTLKRDSGVTVQGGAVKATTFKLGTNATITYNSTTEAIDFTFM